MADNRQTVSDSSNVFLNQAGRDAQVRLENSFSAAQGSAAKPDIVQSMADLKALIDNAIEKGQLGDPDAVARDFEDLANEVASNKPL